MAEGTGTVRIKIGFVPSCPLGNGFLTGTISKNTGVAEENEFSPAQVALAWLLHQKEWIVPIPGTKNKGHLQENMSAAYVKLPEESWQILHNLFEEYLVRAGFFL